MREQFLYAQSFPARLHSVAERPIENLQVKLLRLEFEVFHQANNELRSQGQIVCRDVVIGESTRFKRDAGVVRYFESLHGAGPIDDVATWRSLLTPPRWVRIEFGAREPETNRNDFKDITSYDIGTLKVIESKYDVRAERVTVGEAARKLKVSESTIRRRLQELEPEFGELLSYATAGGHRRINLALLRQFF